jgi:2,3-bisphosphoglycerate-independent phosphoglycerate mutase
MSLRSQPGSPIDSRFGWRTDGRRGSRYLSKALFTQSDSFKRKKNFRILVLPDHPTPVAVKTHTSEPVPFGVFGKDIASEGFLNYSEKEAQKSGLFFEKGHELMEYFLKPG